MLMIIPLTTISQVKIKIKMSVKSKSTIKNDIDVNLASGIQIPATVDRANRKDIVDSYEDFIPSYTSAEIAALSSPVLRQIVYDTVLEQYYFYDGNQWVAMASPKYKRFVGTFTQTGTNAPTVTVHENNLGGTLVWAYTAIGQYTATLVGAFTSLKTMSPQDQTACIDSNTDDAYYIYARRISDDTFRVFTRDNTFSPSDGMLQDKMIEIRVYY